jgi:hypothetical protein
MLEASERASDLAEELASGTTEAFRNPLTGHNVGRAGAEKLRQQFLLQVHDLAGKSPALDKKGRHFYSWRNTFLLLGFLSIFLSKVLQPYQGASLPDKATLPNHTNPASADQTKALP